MSGDRLASPVAGAIGNDADRRRVINSGLNAPFDGGWRVVLRQVDYGADLASGLLQKRFD